MVLVDLGYMILLVDVGYRVDVGCRMQSANGRYRMRLFYVGYMMLLVNGDNRTLYDLIGYRITGCYWFMFVV